jgi:RNA polymerase-interacting CarD/CdnL/TRCF family regulator
MSGDFEYLGSPLDVVQALMDRAWDDEISDDDRQLLETAAKTLEHTLDRCIKLAHVIEKTEAGL